MVLQSVYPHRIPAAEEATWDRFRLAQRQALQPPPMIADGDSMPRTFSSGERLFGARMGRRLQRRSGACWVLSVANSSSMLTKRSQNNGRRSVLTSFNPIFDRFQVRFWENSST